MNRKNHKTPTQALAFVASFCFHTLLLWGAYHLPIKQGGGASSEYSITFHAASGHQESVSEDTKPHHLIDKSINVADQKIAKHLQAGEDPEKILEDAAPEPRDTSEKNPSIEQPKNQGQDIPQVSTTTNQAEKASTTIDKRGLYNAYQNKQTGTLLELPGWTWDAIPQPQDDSDESGKIVLQITIDEFGEIIAVKTLEKTISPLVEAIYKEALTKLTFSKTDDTLAYAPTSTGKVTFILQVR